MSRKVGAIHVLVRNEFTSIMFHSPAIQHDWMDAESFGDVLGPNVRVIGQANGLLFESEGITVVGSTLGACHVGPL